MEIKMSISVEELFEIIGKLSIKDTVSSNIINAVMTVATEEEKEEIKTNTRTSKIKPVCSKKDKVTASSAEDTNGMITSVELQKIIGCSNQTVFNYCSKGMPYVRLNDGQRQYRFDKDKCVAWVAEYTKKRDVNRKDNFYTNVAPKNPKAKKTTGDFAEWQRNIFNSIDAKGLDRGKTCSEVFKYMTKRYGIVWDQVKKDFYNSNNYSAPSTLQAAYWLQTNKAVYKGMFESCLETVIAA